MSAIRARQSRVYKIHRAGTQKGRPAVKSSAGKHLRREAFTSPDFPGSTEKVALHRPNIEEFVARLASARAREHQSAFARLRPNPPFLRRGIIIIYYPPGE